MGISMSGVDVTQKVGTISISVSEDHPLALLSASLDWASMAKLVETDIKRTATFWQKGRRIQVRTHLAAYLLQKIYDYTDRKTECQIKDNAAAQVFCGRLTVDGWRAPDHTKIEEFRNRLSTETQRQLANSLSTLAVKHGFADPQSVDFDSTVQEANVAYPSDACLLRKLGKMGGKIVNFFKEKFANLRSKVPAIDCQAISKKAKEYFFLGKNKSIEIKREVFKELLSTVKKNIKPIIEFCEKITEKDIAKMPWNIRRTICQIQQDARQYLLDVAHFTRSHKIKVGKILSFHAKKLACISKGKVGKALEFGRVFQLARIGGNFLYTIECSSIRMNDKASFSELVAEHEQLFGTENLRSVAADKGYYSHKNRKLLESKNIPTVGLQKPGKAVDGDPAQKTLHYNRRAGIEPVIGHAKHGGQLGKSRMKSDGATLAAGYGSVLGFNLRQMIRHSQGKYRQAA